MTIAFEENTTMNIGHYPDRPPHPNSEWRLIGAPEAYELLELNTNNRKVKWASVDRYAEDMLAGRWNNHEGSPFKIGWNNVLLDGQNRCYAIVMANERAAEQGKPPIKIWVQVLTHVDPEAQFVMDIGDPRTMADQLRLLGAPYPALQAAAIRCIIMFDPESVNTRIPSKPEMIQFYLEHRDSLDGACEGVTWHGTSYVNASVLIAANWLIRRHCFEDAAIKEFFTGITTGADVPSTSPIMALRNRAFQAKHKREVIQNPWGIHMVIRTWNAHRRGEQMKAFPLRKAGKVIVCQKVLR